MRIAYIAHPVSGDIKGNIEKILAIIRKINMEEPDVVPFAPYLGDILAMDDTHPEERVRGIWNNIALFEKGFIDELRLYGDMISEGMQDEIDLADEFGINVVDYQKI